MKRAVLARDSEGASAYVVIDEPIGGLKPAIYHCDYVLRIGDRALFSRTKSFKKLLAVPASWVFKTKEEAQAYAMKRGQLRWCVVENKKGVLGIVLAHVREGLRENFYGDGNRYRSCLFRVGAKEPEYTYGVRHYATKREARQQVSRMIRDRLRKAEKKLRQSEREVARLKRALARVAL